MKNNLSSQHCDVRGLERLVLPGPGNESIGRTLAHISGCETCRERLQVMLALKESLAFETPSNPASPRVTWGIAAALVLVVTLSTLLFLRSPSAIGPADLALDHAPPLFPLSLRAGGENQELQAAWSAYQAGRYRSAAGHFRNTEMGGETRLYFGISLYLSGEYAESVKVLSTLLERGEVTASTILWFRAQALLKLDRADQAVQDLQQINPSSRYRQSADQLLGRLRGMQ